ncbi:MAG TPA: thiol reductant ABC exporter subunit CydD [Gammaproteobacteria bacterium]|nr:thiol reductant ABC exporter subunit CydD [Gammaproteobacteria bacterium]
MEVAAWLREARAPATGTLRALVGTGTLGGALLLLQAWLLARVVATTVFGGAGLSASLPALGGLLAVFAARAGIAWLTEWLGFRAAAAVKLEIRSRLIRHVHAMGPVRLIGEQGGELANAIADGVEALEAYYARFLPQMALAALIPLSILALVFPLDWISGLVLLVTAPCIPMFMVLIGKGAEALNQRQWRRLARLSGHFLDALQGLATLKAFNASRREAALVGRLSEDYRKSTMAVLRVAFLSSLALEFLATVSIALVAVLIGFRLMWGDMSFQSGFVVLLLAPEFYLPLRNLGTHYHARMDAIGAAERMVEILEQPLPAGPRGRRRMTRARSVSVALQDLTARYDDGGPPALDGFSLDLEPGRTVALVGPSGAGKSTVVNLLLGFLAPVSGRILVNGEPLAALEPESWLAHVAWVPQHPHVFHASVRDNIRLARPDAGESAVVEAARLAEAHGFIEALPHGYDTVVGEGGRALSGGQAQRLALARAFLKDAPLVLLDEASASLDAGTEHRLGRAIERLAADRSMLMIAHRLATVRRADRILVLDAGRMVQSGTHADLIARDGLYRRLARDAGAPT